MASLVFGCMVMFAAAATLCISESERNWETLLFPARESLTSEDDLPQCSQSLSSPSSGSSFTTEICNIIQTPSAQDESVIGFQYCNCDQSGHTCGSGPEATDGFTYATIDNMAYKTCRPVAEIPICQSDRGSRAVAKIWYGEDIPTRVLVHCRCPPGTVWGGVQCTTSGRICFVPKCQEL